MLACHLPFRALMLTVMGSLFFAMMGVAQTPIVLDPPAGTEDGVNVINGSTVIIQLRAPGKDYVHLRGDFNNFTADDASLMALVDEFLEFGLWSVKLVNCKAEVRVVSPA